jgi:2-methylisocitrate lyase-like PEP mutase family enzyme
MENKAAHQLVEAIAGAQPVIAPGCYDALTALLIEQAGFSCAYLSGASIAFTRLGRPDLGLTTLTEVADTIGCIRDRVSLPLIVDGDNGFGNALNVQRTVQLFENRGASAIQLEDQQMPKRCGHLEGKRLIPAAEMCGKIRAALDARRSDDTLIIARTDAVAVEGLAAALERAEAYREAGAQILFVESPGDRAELQQIGAALGDRIPLLANMVEGVFPGAMVRVLSRAGAEYLQVLKRDGTTDSLRDRMNDFSQINALIGTDAMLSLAERYEP